jgi:hypothetical protein
MLGEMLKQCQHFFLGDMSLLEPAEERFASIPVNQSRDDRSATEASPNLGCTTRF